MDSAADMLALFLAAASASPPVTLPALSCGLPGGAGTCYSGAAFKRLPELDARGCCEACTATPTCESWEIRADQDDLCVLKAGVQVGGAGNCSKSGSKSGPPSPSPPPDHSGPRINDMFHGGAVLQRNALVSVWGLSTGKSVSLSLSAGGRASQGSAVSLTGPVNASGVWMLFLPPQPGGYNRTLTVTDVSGSTSVTVSFGEAVLCVGQSNMGMQIGPSVRAFDADNATAENAASIRYTGKISLHARISQASWAAGSDPARDAPQSDSTVWYPVTTTNIRNFSAVCWLTGRDLFERLGGEVPVGLAVSSMGAHPIESWLGPDQLEACGIRSYNHGQNGTMCSAHMPLSKIWASTVVPMQPYTFASMIFDQAEADIICKRQADYPCLQKQLISSYREQFNSSSMKFVAVQLPGYMPGDDVFYMRLAQQAGVEGVKDATVIATYDDSCAANKTNGCPHGNVHNVHKQPVGDRLSAQLYAMLMGDTRTVTQGPSATGAAMRALQPGLFQVNVTFSGGTLPLYLFSHFFFNKLLKLTTCRVSTGITLRFDYDTRRVVTHGYWQVSQRHAQLHNPTARS
eukprot:COSAG05_NODE_2996_length_2424_cov_2.078280_2_plen_574_part_00